MCQREKEQLDGNGTKTDKDMTNYRDRGGGGNSKKEILNSSFKFLPKMGKDFF